MMRNSSSSSSLNSSDGSAAASDSTRVLKKGPWTAAEDAILVEYVQKHGEGNWNAVQKNCGLARCGKSCRLRWANHLRPNLKKGSFTHEEEMLILQLHAKLGNKWARMAAQLPGRTDNEIKNFWNTRIKRRQRAGLPLYPSELQIQRRRMAFQCPVTNHVQMVSRPALMDDILRYNYSGEMMDVNENDSAAMYSELPSSQLFYSGGGGGVGESGCGLLQEAQDVGDVMQGKMAMDSMTTAHDDISRLFDMISTPGMPEAPEWYHSATDSCDISDGGQSPVVMHLASSLAPAVDQDWNIGSRPWSSMPGIC